MSAQRDALRRTLEARSDDEQTRALLARAEAEPSTAPADVDALAADAQAGDREARERLLERFLPLIASLARAHAVDGLEHADLVHEGCVGLLRAVARYDATRGVPFAAYARWWVLNAIQDARSDFVRPLRLPPKALRQLSKLKSEHDRIYAREQRDASARELAERTKIDVEHAEALVAADARPRSLDEPVSTADGELGALGDLLADPLSADAYEDVLDAIAGEQLRALVGRLTEREREIVNARFGFDRRAEKLTDVGARLGISAERVRQLEERALSKLRHSAS